MNNELITHSGWWKRNWKWLVLSSVLFIILIAMVLYSGMGKMGKDLAQAYSDEELYQNALDQLQSHPKIIELLGEIEPIDQLAILEGEVYYTNENKMVNSSIRLKGAKGNAKMDITAIKNNREWEYKIINVRIKNPLKNKQTIEIVNND